MADPQAWEVVGGGDKGGILVRDGQSLKSAELPGRLATGSLLEEVDLVEDRLHYKLLTGSGPERGWVSIAIKGKELVCPLGSLQGNAQSTPGVREAPSREHEAPSRVQEAPQRRMDAPAHRFEQTPFPLASQRMDAPVPAASSQQGGPFTRERAKALQRELLKEFKEDGFQQKLRALRSRAEREGLTKTRFLTERSKIFLTVQSQVLPRYGFEGSPKGVINMMADMKPYIKDSEFIDLAEEINRWLGIDYSPPESWNTLTDSCKKLDEQQQHHQGKEQLQHQTESKPAPIRPIGGLLAPVPSLLQSRSLKLPEAITRGLDY